MKDNHQINLLKAREILTPHPNPLLKCFVETSDTDKGEGRVRSIHFATGTLIRYFYVLLANLFMILELKSY